MYTKLNANQWSTPLIVIETSLSYLSSFADNEREKKMNPHIANAPFIHMSRSVLPGVDLAVINDH